MGKSTAIEWTATIHDGVRYPGHTHNPWIGCTKISPACDNCYAENVAKRLGVKWGNNPRYLTKEHNRNEPLRWNREAEATGIRRKVFCASLADWLDNQVPLEWFVDLLSVIRKTRNLDWLLLTKRPQNFARRMLDAYEYSRRYDLDVVDWIFRWIYSASPPSNVWLGGTVENQHELETRGKILMGLPAVKLFLSCEPLLGALTLDSVVGWDKEIAGFNPMLRRVDWIIAGGESGPGARTPHPDWFRSLRDQCKVAGVPFFFKQWGESVYDEATSTQGITSMKRVGKKAAGRMLDGVLHDEWPK